MIYIWTSSIDKIIFLAKEKKNVIDPMSNFQVLFCSLEK